MNRKARVARLRWAHFRWGLTLVELRPVFVGTRSGCIERLLGVPMAVFGALYCLTIAAVVRSGDVSWTPAAPPGVEMMVGLLLALVALPPMVIAVGALFPHLQQAGGRALPRASGPAMTPLLPLTDREVLAATFQGRLAALLVTIVCCLIPLGFARFVVVSYSPATPPPSWVDPYDLAALAVLLATFALDRETAVVRRYCQPQSAIAPAALGVLAGMAAWGVGAASGLIPYTARALPAWVALISAGVALGGLLGMRWELNAQPRRAARALAEPAGAPARQHTPAAAGDCRGRLRERLVRWRDATGTQFGDPAMLGLGGMRDVPRRSARELRHSLAVVAFLAAYLVVGRLLGLLWGLASLPLWGLHLPTDGVWRDMLTGGLVSDVLVAMSLVALIMFSAAMAWAEGFGALWKRGASGGALRQGDLEPRHLGYLLPVAPRLLWRTRLRSTLIRLGWLALTGTVVGAVVLAADGGVLGTFRPVSLLAGACACLPAALAALSVFAYGPLLRHAAKLLGLSATTISFFATAGIAAPVVLLFFLPTGSHDVDPAVVVGAAVLVPIWTAVALWLSYRWVDGRTWSLRQDGSASGASAFRAGIVLMLAPVTVGIAFWLTLGGLGTALAAASVLFD